MTTTTPRDTAAIHDLVEELRFVAGTYDDAVATAVNDVIERPLPEDERRSLLTAVYTHLKASNHLAGDPAAARDLVGDVDEIVRRVLSARQARTAASSQPVLKWKEGTDQKPVRPRPRFHGKDIELIEGFVDIDQLRPWRDNDRLEIHLSAFRKEHGREPTDPELIDIMLSRIMLPGVSREDEFKIEDLADSIAANGIRVPPVVDHWGVPQDGNRRLAACHFVLNSDKYSPEQKRRARTIRVWKMDKDAEPEDYRAVVIGLNFESNHKVEWPEYIKARKIAEEWEQILETEGGALGQSRRTELKRQLAARFVIDTGRVDRYLKMIGWADRFEEHHRERGRGEEAVQQKASEVFQYFAEMSIGKSEGGVDHTLKNDDEIRELTFDLLYDGKIKAFPLIRELPKVARSPEARQALLEAATVQVAPDADPKRDPAVRAARERVSDAVAMARAADAEIRAAGADQKIKTFVAWLRKVPVDVFEEKVDPKTLKALVDAFDLTIPLARAALERRNRA